MNPIVGLRSGAGDPEGPEEGKCFSRERGEENLGTHTKSKPPICLTRGDTWKRTYRTESRNVRRWKNRQSKTESVEPRQVR